MTSAGVETGGALSLMVSRFPTAMPTQGPAYGTMELTTWDSLAHALTNDRRIGDKDGPNIVLARFKEEQNGKARRVKANLIARTAIALDCETDKKTGEVPPDPSTVIDKLAQHGWAAALYTSHNHTAQAPRYRIVLPITAELDPHLPAVEVAASALGLDGVLDRSKLGAASVFYLPSAAPGSTAEHRAFSVTGEPIPAAWMQEHAGALLAAREAEQAAIRAEAMREAERRRQAKAKAGSKPSDKLIEAIRDRLDLAAELTRHGYEQKGDRYLYPDSETGIPGVHILRGSDGIERVYSHHAGDLLAACNLPSWATVKAVDAVDVVAILDFGGDFTKALHTLATRFGIGEPLQAKAAPEEPPGFGDVPLPDKEPGCEKHRYTEGRAQTTEHRSGWTFISPTSLDGKHIPPRKWIVDQWLPAATVTIDFGDGGVGKTLLAQQLMTSTTLGRPWCGLAVHRCRSVALFCEDDADELHRRQDAINAAYGVTFSELGDMCWVSGVGHDNTLVEFDFDGRMIKTQAFERLSAEAIERQAELIVIDTAADTFGGNEILRRQVRQFVGAALGKLAMETGAAVLLNAHPSRSGMSAGGDMDGGSTAWSNTARSRWSLSRPKTGDDEQADADARVLTRRKANYASTGDTIKLRWQRGVLVPIDQPHGLDAMAMRQHVDDAFLSLLTRHNASGVRVGQSNKGGNWAPKLFAKAPDRNGFTAADFEGALGRLLANGTIRMHDFGRAGRPQPGLIVTA